MRDFKAAEKTNTHTFTEERGEYKQETDNYIFHMTAFVFFFSVFYIVSHYVLLMPIETPLKGLKGRFHS